MQILNGSGMRLLEHSLDAATLRQQVTANNIANVDTPNFKRSEVRFAEYLKSASQTGPRIAGYRTHEKHLPIGLPAHSVPQARVIKDERETMMNNNRNNVDIDYEMSLMAKNQMQYNMLVEQLNHEFKLFRTSIGGR